MKILCLHGYTQSGALFARKASAIRKALTKLGHELVFVDAPFKLEPEEVEFKAEDATDMRSWWCGIESEKNYRDLSPAFQFLKEVSEKQGPFNGLIGFSQGSGLSGVLAREWTNITGEPSLSFVILYSGFKLAEPRYQHYYTEKCKTPSLHVIGSMDTIVGEDRSKALVDTFESPKILSHPGGHYVPSQKPYISAVCAFVDQCTAATVDKKTESDKDDDWDEFDKIGQ